MFSIQVQKILPACNELNEIKPAPPGGGGDRGVSWVNFARYVPLASQNPYPIMVSSEAIIIDPIFLVTFGKSVILAIQFSHFLLMHLN